MLVRILSPALWPVSWTTRAPDTCCPMTPVLVPTSRKVSNLSSQNLADCTVLWCHHLRLTPQPALGFSLPKAWAGMEWAEKPVLCEGNPHRAGTKGHVHRQAAQAILPKTPEIQRSLISSLAVPCTWGVLHWRLLWGWEVFQSSWQQAPVLKSLML